MSQRNSLRMLLALNVITVAIVAIADVFNESHLFNPGWPPHARFHIGMQFTTLLLVSLYSAVAFIKKDRIGAAISTLTFWPGLIVASFIPGTSPYAAPALEELGFPINIAIAVVMIVATGLVLGLWRAERGERNDRLTAARRPQGAVS